MHLEDATSSTGGWQKEKGLLENKIDNLTKAYQESLQAQRDGQAQSVNLLAQVRDLRAGLDESELKYSQLQAA
jgi:myosin heavy chain 9/10/11/14